MAYYGIRRNKQGIITSIRICIYHEGSQINKTYRPPKPGMTDVAILAAAEEYGNRVENQLKSTNEISILTPFKDAAEYYIRLGKALGDTSSTERFYHSCMTRINDPEYGFGDIPIGEITAGTINRFLIGLALSEYRYEEKVRCVVDLQAYLKDHGMTIYAFSKQSGISDTTLYSCRDGRNILRSTAEKICSFFGDDPDKVFAPAEYNYRKLSTTYMNSHITFIRSVFTQAVKEHVLMFNPTDSTRKFKGPSKEETVLSIDELKRICTLLRNDDDLEMVAFTMLLIFTGARNGEICGLKWDNVNFETTEIYLCNNRHAVAGEGVTEGPLKNKTNRLISIDSAVMDILKRWKTCQQMIWPCSEYVFSGKKGTHIYPTSPARWLSNFSGDNDLPHLHPHMFRHSHASILIAEGADVTTVSKRRSEEHTSELQSRI